MSQENYVVLEITSWQGMSFGATHYYGALVGYNDGNYLKCDIKKIMSKEDAKELSEKDDWKYKAGNTTTRFNSEDEIRTIALKTWKTLFPKCNALLEGRFACAEPQKCLWIKNSKYINKLNELWKENESISNISKNWEKIDALCDAFNKLLEEVTA